jgi:hypothetical protein
MVKAMEDEKQERETMGHNEYSGAQLYTGDRRRDDDSFP